MLNTSWIIFIVSVAIYAAMFIAIPVRRKIAKKNSGKLLMKIAEPALYRSTVIILLSLMLIIFAKVRDFKLVSQLILVGCGLLGEYMSMNDYAYFRMSGVYENGILVNGTFLPFENITCFPILQLPEEEQEKYDKSSLVLATTKKPTVTLMFASEEECAEAVEKILEVKPELKTW